MSKAAAGRPLRVGLTGGLACGKSTVAEVFAGLGAVTVDADRLAREALAPGAPLVAKVAARLGGELLDRSGGLDRARLAARVFADPQARRTLEELVHPEVIRREEEAFAAAAAAGAGIVVGDVPLIFEAGRAGCYDRLVVVAADEALQLARAVARGLAAADARRRIDAQLPIAEKAARADYVIDSSGSVEETRERARRVWAALEEDRARLAAGLPLAPRRRPAAGGR